VAEIVFVHGIANEQLSADRLEETWREQVAGGLRAARRDDLADRVVRDRSLAGAIDSRMAFYGNLFLEPGGQGVAGGLADAEQQRLADQLATEWLENVASRSSSEVDREEAARTLAIAQRGDEGAQGFGAVTGTVFKAISRVPYFAEATFGAAAFVARALRQVVLYLEDPKIRPEAQHRVLKLLGPETRVLIGHSLGSVVAYEALHYAKETVPLFLTIGSPLGLRRIVYPKIWPQPPVYPKMAARWVNIADHDDFIAGETDLEQMFPGANGRFRGTWTVDNGSSPHDAEFYLGKESIGREIAAVLS
jgi:hypothetical protein